MTSDDHSPLPDDDQATVTVPDVPADREALAAAAAAMRLVELVREIEKHVADLGWDQNPRLFALVGTERAPRARAALATALGETAADPDVAHPHRAGGPRPQKPLDELLARIAWPDEVARLRALVLERLMLPPSAEEAAA